MRSIEEIRKSCLSVDELFEEKIERNNLINQMVGNLYPDVLRNEIDEIDRFLNIAIVNEI